MSKESALKIHFIYNDSIITKWNQLSKPRNRTNKASHKSFTLLHLPFINELE